MNEDTLRHLKPDTIIAIIRDLTEAEHNDWFSPESKPTDATLQVRDACVTYMQTEWASLEYAPAEQVPA